MCGHFEDPVYQEAVALADLPQFGFPDDAKIRTDSIHFGLSDDSNTFRHQMRSLILGSAQLIRQKTAESPTGPANYGFGMYGDDPFVTATAIDEMIQTGFSLDENKPNDPPEPLEVVHRGLLRRRKAPHDD